jgi:hypothetical protein
MKDFVKKKFLCMMGLGISAIPPMGKKEKKKEIGFDQSISHSETLTRVINTNFQKEVSKSA